MGRGGQGRGNLGGVTAVANARRAYALMGRTAALGPTSAPCRTIASAPVTSSDAS